MNHKFLHVFFATLLFAGPCWAKGEDTLAAMAGLLAPKTSEEGLRDLEKQRVARRERAKKIVAGDVVVFPDYWLQKNDKQASAAVADKKQAVQKSVPERRPPAPPVESPLEKDDVDDAGDDDAFLAEQEELRRAYEKSAPADEIRPVAAEKPALAPVAPAIPEKREDEPAKTVSDEPPCLVGRPCVLCSASEPLWDGRQCVAVVKKDEEKTPEIKKAPEQETRLQKLKREQRERIEKKRQERLKKNKKKK